MFKLLNRFAFCISQLMGFVIIFSFMGLIGGSSFYGEEVLIILFFSVIAGSIFKKLFLSKQFVQDRVIFFQTALLDDIGTIPTKTNTKVEVEKEIPTSLPMTEKTEEKVEVVDSYSITDFQKDTIEKYSRTEQQEDKIENNYTYSTKEEEEEDDDTTPQEPSQITIYIKNFFSENVLAKIGSILVFLGVVFLMSLIWGNIPSSVKVIIGFIIGFGIYITGVILDRKGLSGEGKTLLGTGILINFLVILAGKHLLEGNYGVSDDVLSTGITFLLLILNTVFGVITSLVYQSRTILLFSFIFAYINPFLTGETIDSTYTLVGYSMIVSLGAMFIGIKQNDMILKYSAFILGNLLFLSAPFSSVIGWITKLVASGILGLLTIVNFSKTTQEQVLSVCVINYVFITLFISSGGDSGIIKDTSSFISYMLSILFFFGISIWLFLKESLKSVNILLFFPIFIILGLIFSGSALFVAPLLAIVILAYLISFMFIESALSGAVKYIFFSILGLFIFLVNSYISYDLVHLDLISFFTVIIVSFVFIITTYWLSRKDNLEFLYSIGTLGGILTLAPILLVSYITNTFDSEVFLSETIVVDTNIMVTISIISTIIFGLLNIILPFINKNLTKSGNSIKNLIVGSIFGVLFIGFQLFAYGVEYFPGKALGFAFLALAILYCMISFFMVKQLGIEKIKADIISKNTIFSYLFISISLFSLAIVMVFSDNPEIISTIWLFEATILFYFFNKTKENKIFILGIILFIIGIIQLFEIAYLVQESDYKFLVPFTVIFGSLVLNIKMLDSIKEGAQRVFHDIFHILGIITLTALLEQIIPNTSHGWSTLGTSLFVFALGVLYSFYHSKILKIFFIVFFTYTALWYTGGLSSILMRIDIDDLSSLRILQYISFGIITGTIIIWNKLNTKKFYNLFINSIYVLYGLFMISYFVYDIFNTTFAITFFWGIVSSYLLFYGISTDKIKLRTIGLYLLSLVLLKIFIYDIGFEIDNAVTRVVALIVIGILLIVISTRYTKKYGNNLKGELSISNIIGTSEENKDPLDEDVLNDIQKEESLSTQENTLMKTLKEVNIEGLTSVTFIVNNDNTFSTRAKNLLRIVKFVTTKLNKNTFEPSELNDIYTYIIQNYQSELSKRDYETITNAIKNFVDKGGEIKIKK